MNAQRVMVLVAALAPAGAWACSCAFFPDVVPRDGATDVPTNVVLRAIYPVASPAAPTASLTNASTQQAVEFDAIAGPAPFLRSFAPRVTLEPRTAYTFVIDEQSFTFTTGDGEDHTPPATPELQGVDYSASSACGPRRAWSLQLTGGDDGEFVLAQLSSSDELADAAGVAHVRSPTFATATCGTNFEPPEGSSFPMAVQVMDLAGNLSGLSTTRQVSGCATTPGLTVFLMLAWLIRRARG